MLVFFPRLCPPNVVTDLSFLLGTWVHCIALGTCEDTSTSSLILPVPRSQSELGEVPLPAVCSRAALLCGKGEDL
jgi:hypothetical protein